MRGLFGAQRLSSNILRKSVSKSEKLRKFVVEVFTVSLGDFVNVIKSSHEGFTVGLELVDVVRALISANNDEFRLPLGHMKEGLN